MPRLDRKLVDVSLADRQPKSPEQRAMLERDVSVSIYKHCEEPECRSITWLCGCKKTLCPVHDDQQDKMSEICDQASLCSFTEQFLT